MKDKSKKAVESANKRWGSIKRNDANASSSQCDRIDILCEGNAIKEKKIKENKRKEILVKENIAPKVAKIKFEKPTIEILTTYIQENDLKVDPSTFFDYYESNGWLIGRAPMKNWQSTARNWSRKQKSENTQVNIVRRKNLSMDEALEIAGNEVREEERLAKLKIKESEAIASL